MRKWKSADLPLDPFLAEWAKPRTFEEWIDYYESEGPSLQQQIDQFIAYLIYFAKSDLCYISNVFLEKPSNEIISCLVFIATLEQADPDPETIKALWAIRDSLNGDRSSRWQIQWQALEKVGCLEN